MTAAQPEQFRLHQLRTREDTLRLQRDSAQRVLDQVTDQLQRDSAQRVLDQVTDQYRTAVRERTQFETQLTGRVSCQA